MPALPFKLNQDRRHHIPEQKRKVTNWRDYDESLRRRGSLTVWFSDEAVEAWEPERRTSRGGQPEYSDRAILTALTFKAVFRLAYRQTEGRIGSVIGLLGLDLAVPDHTTLCRRAETMEGPRPKPRGDGADSGAGRDTGPMHLLVDSTGLKLDGAGEWLVGRYTTLLRAIELWGAVQADGPGRLAGDEELPPVNGLVVCREESFSQQIKANPEDRLSTAFVGLDDDGPVFRLPFTGRVGERKGTANTARSLADPVGVNHVGILEIEAPRLGGRKKRFDLPPPPVMGQGALGIGVGGDYKQVSADQPRRSPFQCRSKRAVA